MAENIGDEFIDENGDVYKCCFGFRTDIKKGGEYLTEMIFKTNYNPEELFPFPEGMTGVVRPLPESYYAGDSFEVRPELIFQ